MEGADPQRAAFLALWHDSQETRTTDQPHLTKRYVAAAANEQVTGDQVRLLPSGMVGMIRGAIAEYAAGETPEACCARDADKLECLFQAREYEDQGTVTCSRGLTPRSRACTRRRPSSCR
jgi:putative hydrolase of HD superfamily